MKLIKNLAIFFLPYHSSFRKFSQAKLTGTYLNFLKFKLGIDNRYWPAHKNCIIANAQKIFVGVNADIGRAGNYIQGAGVLYVGNYTRVATNVGILTSNHDLYDHRKSKLSMVKLGDYCWVGMNCVILPGVILGTRTIVAAGSVVTKSFPEGFCVIGGSPAKIIKELDSSKFIPWIDEEEYYGFVPKDEFENHLKYKAFYDKIRSFNNTGERG